jgi:hypothetical protein
MSENGTPELKYLQLKIPQRYTIRTPTGKEPKDVIIERDKQVMMTILTLLAQACDSQADVSFSIDKVYVASLKVDSYSIDMYVETNTNVIIDMINAITVSYPSRVLPRSHKIRTTRRPDASNVYATHVHLNVTTDEYALRPAHVDVCHIYSPPIPLRRNVVTGMYAVISSAADDHREGMGSHAHVPVIPTQPVATAVQKRPGMFSNMLSSWAPQILRQNTLPSSMPEDYIMYEESPPMQSLKRPRIEEK